MTTTTIMLIRQSEDHLELLQDLSSHQVKDLLSTVEEAHTMEMPTQPQEEDLATNYSTKEELQFNLEETTPHLMEPIMEPIMDQEDLTRDTCHQELNLHTPINLT